MLNKTRLNRVLDNMRTYGLNQILVTGTHSIYYLTGYFVQPGERLLALYLDLEGRVILYANRMFALDKIDNVELIEYDDTDDPIALVAKDVMKGALGIDKQWPSEFTIRLMMARNDVVPMLGSAPIDDARMQKDADEIAIMREASRLNDMALKRTIAQIHAGMTEIELQEAYLNNVKAVGSPCQSFAPITCFGANCAEPHHDNDNTVLKSGDSIIMDVGLMHKRYCSDITRTVFLGSASEEQRRVYDLVKRANEAGRKAIRPGVPMYEFDRAARKIIDDGGYGKYFIHRTGHGIGLQVHEYPDNSETCTLIAKPGMCFSVEPGVYLKGKFGVRVEDLVCVTETGCETLNALDRELTII